MLIWCLVLALPAQGAAAASMMICGQAHHGDAQVALHELHDADSSGASNEEQGCHADMQKCSACADCCSVGAVPATAPSVPITDPAPAVFSALTPSVEALATEGLYRPPRRTLV